ncbi:MAG TPA: ArsA family ATPase, partial [Gemmatimonadaceae bacterium]
MSALDALLDILPSRVLVCGKGGVGKTTCAAALATRAAARSTGGARTLILSTDPARSLGDALGVALNGSPACVADRAGLAAMQLDPVAARDGFLSRWRDVLVTIVDRGTYLGRDDIVSLVDAALPGLDETMALLTLLDLEEEGWERMILDTAPTGHTLRLLALPDSFLALLALLDTMQEKHRFMVRALTHRYRSDTADRFLDLMRERLDALRAALVDPDRFAVVLVARAEALVVEETARYACALAGLGLAPRAIVVNALPDLPARDLDAEVAAALVELSRIAPGAARYHVPLLHSAPLGIPGIDRWGEALSAGCNPPAPREARRTPGNGVVGSGSRARENPRLRGSSGLRESWRAGVEGAPFNLPAIRALTIVGGKGGVGKTSVACALGVALASPEHPTLVVSTDPAPSVADALAQPVAEDVVPVAGAPGLFAQQLDASAAFARFRERYRARVDALFDALLRGTLDAAHDRLVARDLLALAPPGIDELYALAVLGETLATGQFATVIVDPAPTGHLLRLLELPGPALEWSHRLLRLVLEYKEIVPLGQAAEEMLGFAR